MFLGKLSKIHSQRSEDNGVGVARVNSEKDYTSSSTGIVREVVVMDRDDGKLLNTKEKSDKEALDELQYFRNVKGNLPTNSDDYCTRTRGISGTGRSECCEEYDERTNSVEKLDNSERTPLIPSNNNNYSCTESSATTERIDSRASCCYEILSKGLSTSVALQEKSKPKPAIDDINKHFYGDGMQSAEIAGKALSNYRRKLILNQTADSAFLSAGVSKVNPIRHVNQTFPGIHSNRDRAVGSSENDDTINKVVDVQSPLIHGK